MNDKATATEKMELKITYLNMVSYGENTRKATLQELADGLFADKDVEYVKLKNQEIASLEPIDVTGENSFFVKLKEYSYEFEIDENLQLASVDGVKVANSGDNYNLLKEEVEGLKNELENLKNNRVVLYSNPAKSYGGENSQIAEVECATVSQSKTYTILDQPSNYKKIEIELGSEIYNSTSQNYYYPHIASHTWNRDANIANSLYILSGITKNPTSNPNFYIYYQIDWPQYSNQLKLIAHNMGGDFKGVFLMSVVGYK